MRNGWSHAAEATAYIVPPGTEIKSEHQERTGDWALVIASPQSEYAEVVFEGSPNELRQLLIRMYQAAKHLPREQELGR